MRYREIVEAGTTDPISAKGPLSAAQWGRERKRKSKLQQQIQDEQRRHVERDQILKSKL